MAWGKGVGFEVQFSSFGVLGCEFPRNEVTGPASGNVTLETVHSIGQTGVTGALTHSVKALDISLKIDTELALQLDIPSPFHMILGSSTPYGNSLPLWISDGRIVAMNWARNDSSMRAGANCRGTCASKTSSPRCTKINGDPLLVVVPTNSLWPSILSKIEAVNPVNLSCRLFR
ncbi:hypothetical protein RJ639_030759 [Escallonia herrerae]|uniref:Quinolinate phosphoribosyl transferase C-terminal domain-containing protein n=1 Tax=Escallonia herrerae TaxID=1293975 RepID=A0AA89BN40_9ASTE|nr:hypothetical protein RJ639_030759 [Escallonia herrerae]